jgi:hypothetical protein
MLLLATGGLSQCQFPVRWNVSIAAGPGLIASPRGIAAVSTHPKTARVAESKAGLAKSVVLSYM